MKYIAILLLFASCSNKCEVPPLREYYVHRQSEIMLMSDPTSERAIKQGDTVLLLIGHKYRLRNGTRCEIQFTASHEQGNILDPCLDLWVD